MLWEREIQGTIGVVKIRCQTYDFMCAKTLSHKITHNSKGIPGKEIVGDVARDKTREIDRVQLVENRFLHARKHRCWSVGLKTQEMIKEGNDTRSVVSEEINSS